MISYFTIGAFGTHTCKQTMFPYRTSLVFQALPTPLSGIGTRLVPHRSSNMKSHFYSSSLSGQPIPEEEEVSAYMTSSSCSSLENGSSFRYPPDLLGVSWGSYLQSDPPTRAGRSPKKVVINTTLKPPQSTQNLPPADKAPARSILRTPVAKEGTANRKLPVEALSEPHPLMHELHVLIEEVTSGREELRKYGIDTTPLTNFCDSLTTENYDLKQLVDQLERQGDVGKEVILGGVLKLVIQFLRSVLRSIVEEGKRLQEQATFLQHTGKQLSKLQENFMKEQEEVQQAVEDTKAQLALEKVGIVRGDTPTNITMGG